MKSRITSIAATALLGMASPVRVYAEAQLTLPAPFPTGNGQEGR